MSRVSNVDGRDEIYLEKSVFFMCYKHIMIEMVNLIIVT